MASPTHHRAVALLLTGALALGLTRALSPQAASPASSARSSRIDASDAGRGAAPAPRADVDANRATEAELIALPGIGPALARRIIEARDRGGPFLRPSDLERVRGIGPRTAARLAEHLRFDQSSPDASHELVDAVIDPS